MFVWLEYQPMFPKRALSFSDNVSFSFWSMIWSSSLASVIVQCASCGTKQRDRWCISYLTRPWNEFSETVVFISYFQIIEMYTYVFVYIFVFSKKNTLQDSYTNTHLLSSAAIILKTNVLGTLPKKKRENVEILKKQGGGLPESHFHVLLFLTWENPQKRS